MATLSRSISVLPCLLILCADLLLLTCSSSEGQVLQEETEGGAPVGRQPRLLTLLEVEPRRDVPAAQWNSPYCGRWFDGCDECSRKSTSDEPRCWSRQRIDLNKCNRHAVLCLAPISIKSLTSICTAYEVEDYFYDQQGLIVARSKIEITDVCERTLLGNEIVCKYATFENSPLTLPWGYKYWQLSETKRVLIFPLIPDKLPLLERETYYTDITNSQKLNSISRVPFLEKRYLPYEYGYSCIRNRYKAE